MLKLKLQYLATWCEELTHWRRPWCWERLKVGGEGEDRGFNGWMASLTWWTWIWTSSWCWWWTGKPDVLQSMGSQWVRHNWATELNWTELKLYFTSITFVWDIHILRWQMKPLAMRKKRCFSSCIKTLLGTSLADQWLRIPLPVQGHGLDPWFGKIPQILWRMCSHVQLFGTP